MMRVRVDLGDGITAVLGRIKGRYRVTEICITDPDVAKLRGIRLRDIEAMARTFGGPQPRHIDCRREDETAADFSRRIAREHAALSATSDRPTTDLAAACGVPIGTAAAWISRARARGLYPAMSDTRDTLDGGTTAM